MAKYYGIVVYEILPDGCLNGVWADTYGKKQIFNELAKKSTAYSEHGVIGTYDCSYTDVRDTLHMCKLKIDDSKQGHFKLLWYNKPDEYIAEGTGWLTRHNQITVYFKWSM